jgi:hypothetical protein
VLPDHAPDLSQFSECGLFSFSTFKRLTWFGTDDVWLPYLACAVLRAPQASFLPGAAMSRGVLAGMYRCHQPRKGASP